MGARQLSGGGRLDSAWLFACPVGHTILTYSESSNPASPHYADQTKLFSKKQFLPDRFCPAQIAADPNLQTVTVTGN